MAASSPTVVLVHGAWHGPWCWDGVRAHLTDAGIPSAAVSLPSSTPRLGGLNDDVATLNAALDDLTGPFVIAAHSYGGIPTTAIAATRIDVAHTIYVCAFAIPAGASLQGTVGGRPLDWWLPSEDGRSFTAADPDRRFFNACAPTDAAIAVPRLTPQSTRSFQEPLPRAAYGQLPATYIVCTRDAAIPAPMQHDMARRLGGTTVELDADHSPWLSRPSELAAIVSDVAGSIPA
jgi:pimeloyl-ACP methyl ester carboxylesterase